MSSVDAHAILGIDPGASDDEVARAYRELAKRFHPDVNPGSGSAELMARINAAYDALRGGVESVPDAGDAPAQRPVHGAWLAPAVRRALAPELLRALEPGEEVVHVARTAMWDSHEVQLAVTDRRLLWLRDDAISDRVRFIRHGDVERVEVRPPRRLRRVGELRVTTRLGRRLGFGELRPDRLEALGAAVRGAVG